MAKSLASLALIVFFCLFVCLWGGRDRHALLEGQQANAPPNGNQPLATHSLDDDYDFDNLAHHDQGDSPTVNVDKVAATPCVRKTLMREKGKRVNR